ncbi:hypothetical protein R4U18_001635 [Salmonella enterica]|nr:hypothetical protein [Salmonella enterica]
MQCPYSREMPDRFSVSQQCNLRWEYSLCQSCGKIGADYLHNYDKSQLLETGYSARIKYRDKTKNKKSNQHCFTLTNLTLHIDTLIY